ncbi:MAG: GntR family transcriptional regulator, partial [Chloroflexi bacterium]|nr:GntR family transcriptional regulator [Chloroflexota bacterium]
QGYLLDLVKAETLQPGEQLPSENELAIQLGVSRSTLREALLNLEQEGVIVRKHGVGTFVASGYGQQLETGLERLESVLELAARQGLQTAVADLQTSQEPASAELAARFQISADTLVTRVSRVIVVRNKPVAYMVDVAPAFVLSPADLEASFNGSVLDLLRRKPDVHIAQAVADIMALNADDLMAAKLRVAPQQALLLLEETLFNDQCVAVEFSCNYFIPEYFRFHVVRR